eukprot:Sspe_Gene.5848::Locus_1947_Transcript_1_1_Confidence_1.000_Length_361::g.5848::m.5848
MWSYVMGNVLAAVAVLLLSHGAAGEGKMLVMPDLGRRLALGNLYDARSDKPVSGSLWPREIIDQLRVEKPARSSEYKFALDDTLTEKAKLIDLGLDLKMSFMGGDVKV